jgi:hypothetical protein
VGQGEGASESKAGGDGADAAAVQSDGESQEPSAVHGSDQEVEVVKDKQRKVKPVGAGTWWLGHFPSGTRLLYSFSASLFAGAFQTWVSHGAEQWQLWHRWAGPLCVCVFADTPPPPPPPSGKLSLRSRKRLRETEQQPVVPDADHDSGSEAPSSDDGTRGAVVTRPATAARTPGLSALEVQLGVVGTCFEAPPAPASCWQASWHTPRGSPLQGALASRTGQTQLGSCGSITSTCS